MKKRTVLLLAAALLLGSWLNRFRRGRRSARRASVPAYRTNDR